MGFERTLDGNLIWGVSCTDQWKERKVSCMVCDPQRSASACANTINTDFIALTDVLQSQKAAHRWYGLHQRAQSNTTVMFSKFCLAISLCMRPTVCVENIMTTKNDWLLLKPLAMVCYFPVFTMLFNGLLNKCSTAQLVSWAVRTSARLIWPVIQTVAGTLFILAVCQSFTLCCPLIDLLAYRNWQLGWISSLTPAYKTILSGPISSSGRPPSTLRCKTRSERFTSPPLRTNNSSLPRSR